ncbi:MAG: hypothetical protein IPO81_30760 [Kouleothrix sp.]|nr:hypothetical protein [Kouleothrix sp.]
MIGRLVVGDEELMWRAPPAEELNEPEPAQGSSQPPSLTLSDEQIDIGPSGQIIKFFVPTQQAIVNVFLL